MASASAVQRASLSVPIAKGKDTQIFPDEIIVEIFKNLTFKELQGARSVCRQWRRVSWNFQLLKEIEVPLPIRVKLNSNPKKHTLSFAHPFSFTFYARFIFVGTREGDIKVLDNRTFKEIDKKQSYYPLPIYNLIAEKNRLLSVTANTLTVWEINKEGISKSWLLTVPDRKIIDASFDGDHILVASQNKNNFCDMRIHIVNLKDKRSSKWDMGSVTFSIFQNVAIFSSVEAIYVFDLNKNDWRENPILPKLDVFCETWTYHRGHIFIFRAENRGRANHRIEVYNLTESEKLSFLSSNPVHFGERNSYNVSFRQHDAYFSLFNGEKQLIFNFSNNHLCEVARIDPLPKAYKLIPYGDAIYLIEPDQISRASCLNGDGKFHKITACDLKGFFTYDETKLPEGYKDTPNWRWNGFLKISIHEDALYWSELGFSLNALNYKEQELFSSKLTK